MTAEACAHIDRIFRTIDDPIWMPQFGFEQWSTFYLQRRGFSAEQVKHFVRSFNAVIRHQIGDADSPAEEAALFERLRQASLVDLAAESSRLLVAQG
jgi:anaerobic magnesium-protoporphyrin IX monomethyl ester cyclase